MLTDIGRSALNSVTTFAQGAMTGFENSMFGSLAQKIVAGHAGSGLLSQWAFGALLAGATAAVAFTIGHVIPWDQIGGPKVDTALTQKLEPGPIAGTVENVPMTVGELLFKPALEGLGEYGIASALGVKDAEALGIGAAAGAYAAPFVINGVRLSGIDDLSSIGVYQFGLTSYDTSRIYGVSGQVTALIGGIAGVAYDGNYSLGAYGASQVFSYNDVQLVAKKKNIAGSYDVWNVGNGQDLEHIGITTDPTISGIFTPDAQYTSIFPADRSMQELGQILQPDGAWAHITGVGSPSSGTPVIFTQDGVTYVPGVPQDTCEFYTFSNTIQQFSGIDVTLQNGNYTAFPSQASLDSANYFGYNLILALAGGGLAAELRPGTQPEVSVPSDAPETGITLYRAVSADELQSIADTGGLGPGGGSMENKWFATTPGDAAAWGKTFYSFTGEPFFTIQVQIPDEVASQLFKVPNLDGIGPAFSADPPQIQLINQTGKIGVLNGNVVPK